MKRSGPLRRLTRLKPMSAKRRALAPKRRALVKELLAKHPICEVCGTEPSVACHERLTRARGGDILDEAGITVVCALCHRRIHSEPAWATEKGLLVSAFDVQRHTDRG